MIVLVYDNDEESNNKDEENSKNEDIDINAIKKELNFILSKYLEDRVYLENKIDNWIEAIFQESEKILLNYKDHKTFIHITIHDRKINGYESLRKYGLYSNACTFDLEFKSDKIKAFVNIIMFKRNIKRTKRDLSKVLTMAEKEFLNLAEGREYNVFMEKYYKLFEDKFFKELISGYKYSLFYFIETSNKYYKSSKGFKIINKEKDDFILYKFINAGDIKFYIAFGKAN